MSQFISKLLAAILLALILIQRLNDSIDVPPFLYYLFGFVFLLMIAFTYWKDRKVGLSLFVLLLALITGGIAVYEVLQ